MFPSCPKGRRESSGGGTSEERVLSLPSCTEEHHEGASRPRKEAAQIGRGLYQGERKKCSPRLIFMARED